MARNLSLLPWHAFLRNLTFWQAVWFLYFQQELSAAEAILLYVLFDLTVTVFEVPSGYLSDRVGRTPTLLLSAIASLAGVFLLWMGGPFWVFALGQVALGVGGAFHSGTDTALLYQSLAGEEREAEMEAQSIRIWRFSFAALMLSAVTGGALAGISLATPFAVTALAAIALVGVTLALNEPKQTSEPGSEWVRIRHVVASLKSPSLLWLFLLGVIMYGFSHIPFVFGQPFIDASLTASGLVIDAPLISGTVTSVMMALSLLVSLAAPRIRAKLGLTAMLLLAFGIQVGLATGLAVFGSAFAISLLLLRMVPDSLSSPFILAQLQAQLSDDIRASFVSMKSFLGRMVFAASLGIAAGTTSDVGEMSLSDIQAILWAYALGGALILAVMTVAATRIRIG